MGEVTFDKLYDIYNTLSQAKDNITQHTQEYLEAIEGTKGGEKEKKLAAQVISKFFKHFPSLQLQAIDAIFDICEDDQASIRIAAMKTLPILCKESKENIGKIADVLSQLLQLDDPQEYNVASNSLIQVLQIDSLLVIKSIFKQLSESDALVREKCLKFLVTKVKTLDKSIFTPEIEDLILAEFKKILNDVTADEFVLIMGYLSTSKAANTQAGQIELINICADQVEMDQDLDMFDKDANNIDRLVTCVKFVLPFFSAKIESTKFVKYYCDQTLPRWDEIKELTDGESYQLMILRQLAELSTHCGKLENPSVQVVQIYDKIKTYMPPPPEDTTLTTLPSLDFSSVEALLYAFHRLARQCPDFLTHDPQELKEFRARLMYFSRGVQGCRNAIKADKTKTLSEENEKVMKISPIMFDNINTIIKDLFYQPPMYKCNVTLSFKTEVSPLKKTTEVNVTQKRHVPITFESKNGSAPPYKQGRPNRSGDNVKLYTPPSGKFSNNFQHYDRQRGNRFGGRGGRGGLRGRGSGRGWRN
nr:apoptosis inhibitor 5 [Onthophagus taurus]